MDSPISRLEPLENSDSENTPEYTVVYSGFFLDGILNICITPLIPFTLLWKLELIDHELEGTCQFLEDKFNELCESGKLIDKVLEGINEVYLLSAADEAREATKQ